MGVIQRGLFHYTAQVRRRLFEILRAFASGLSDKFTAFPFPALSRPLSLLPAGLTFVRLPHLIKEYLRGLGKYLELFPDEIGARFHRRIERLEAENAVIPGWGKRIMSFPL